MSPEQFATVLGAVALVLTALGGILAQLRQTHGLMNSRMDQIIRLTENAAHAQGVLDEQHSQADSSGSGSPPAA